MKKFTRTSTFAAALVAVIAGLGSRAHAYRPVVTLNGAPTTTDSRATRALAQTRAAIQDRLQREEAVAGSRIFLRSFDLAVDPGSPALAACESRTMDTGIATVSYRSSANATLRSASFDVCVSDSSQIPALMVRARVGTLAEMEAPGTARFVSQPALRLEDSSDNCDLNARKTIDVCAADADFEIVGVGEPTFSGSPRSVLREVLPSSRGPHCLAFMYDLVGGGTEWIAGIRNCPRGGARIDISIPIEVILKPRR